MGRKNAFSIQPDISLYPSLSQMAGGRKQEETIPISLHAKLVPCTGSLSAPLAYNPVFVKQNVYFFLCGITIDISLTSSCTSSSALISLAFDISPLVFTLLTAISSSNRRFFVAGSSDGVRLQTCCDMVLNNSIYGGEAIHNVSKLCILCSIFEKEILLHGGIKTYKQPFGSLVEYLPCL